MILYKKQHDSGEKDMKSTRKLAWGDTFRLAKIIKAGNITPSDIYELVNLKNKLQTNAENKDDAQEKMGISLLGYVMDRFPACETTLNAFLASMAGIKPEDIEKAELKEVVELIVDIFQENKDIKDFFIRALRSANTIPST